MNKVIQQTIVNSLKLRLGDDYEKADIHSDDIDNAALAVARALCVDEDDVRYYGNLPR